MARVNLGQMYAEVAGRTALWDRPSTCVSLALQACEPPCVCHMLISELDTWCGRRLPAGRSGTRSSHETGCNGQGLRQNAEGSSLSLRQRPMMIYESTMPILIHYDLSSWSIHHDPWWSIMIYLSVRLSIYVSGWLVFVWCVHLRSQTSEIHREFSSTYEHDKDGIAAVRCNKRTGDAPWPTSLAGANLPFGAIIWVQSCRAASLTLVAKKCESRMRRHEKTEKIWEVRSKSVSSLSSFLRIWNSPPWQGNSTCNCSVESSMA